MDRTVGGAMTATTRLVTLVLMLIVKQPVQAIQNPALDQILQKMEKANTDYPSLQGNIQKAKYTAFLKTLDDPQTGKFWILHMGNAPRRIKFDFDKPVREFILLDKGSFTVYDPATKDGNSKDIAKDEQSEGECVLLGLCQSSAVIKRNYDIAVLPTETVDGIMTTVLELKPKDKKRAQGIASIKLWLDPVKWIPVQARTTENNKDYWNFKYSDIKTTAFPDSVFKLDIPKDATIKKLK
jgi:outer membrane lipoprotein-sorting protein